MSLSYETPLLVIASEKQGPVGTPLLRSREIDELPMRDIRALWAAKSIFRGDRHRERENTRLDGGEGGIRTHG
jgi:hypothetical protein